MVGVCRYLEFQVSLAVPTLSYFIKSNFINSLLRGNEKAQKLKFMKKTIKKLIFIIVVALSLSSCATFFSSSSSSVQYDKTYPLASYSTLINGYWGDWKKTTDYAGNYNYKVRTKYSMQSLEILIYEKDKHPSDYAVKITIDKRTGKVHDKVWFSYQGTISTIEYLPINMDYGFNKCILDWNGNIWCRDFETHQCTIWCDNTMLRAIQENGLVGTINVFYGNGSGNGFTFR